MKNKPIVSSKGRSKSNDDRNMLYQSLYIAYNDEVMSGFKVYPDNHELNWSRDNKLITLNTNMKLKHCIKTFNGVDPKQLVDGHNDYYKDYMHSPLNHDDVDSNIYVSLLSQYVCKNCGSDYVAESCCTVCWRWFHKKCIQYTDDFVCQDCIDLE